MLWMYLISLYMEVIDSLSCIVYIMDADDLAPCVARASADVVLTYFNPICL